MDRRKVLAASAIFLLLTLVKLLLPGAVREIRGGAEALLSRDTDYTRVFAYINDKLAVFRREDDGGAEETCAAGGALAQAVYLELRPVEPAGETAAVRREPELALISGEIWEEPAVPEAMAVFLASQEEFAAYAIPANVTYEYSELPFAYASPVSGYESSGFGYRVHPIQGVVKFHYGTDLAAWTGENVCAFADGTVTFAGYSDSYGYYITIDHGGGWSSLYAHCSALYAEYGESVDRGEVIALVGDTGLATGPHLHFELMADGVYVNPEYYINSL